MHEAIRMTLAFDPLANPDTRRVFEDHLAMTFYLLWRRSHVVGDDFAEAVTRIIARLRTHTPPYAADDVFRAIEPEISGTCSFTRRDATAFSSEVLPFLNGEAEIKWRRKPE